MSKEDCILCQIVEGSVPSETVYEDNEVVAVLDVNGANPGHAFVFPKQHHTIFEQVPESLVSKTFLVANKVSSAIFDTLQVEGTNLFVTNGIAAGQQVAHFMVNVIPRKSNDGINLTWQPQKLSDEEMDTLELQLKEACKHVGVGGETGPALEAPSAVQKVSETDSETGDENYLFRQMKRLP